MIQLNFTEKDLLDSDSRLRLVSTIFYLRRFKTNERLNKCLDYYDGKQPTITFAKANGYTPRVVNLTKPICDTATQTFIGDLPNIITRGKKKENDKISAFNQKLYNREFGSHILELAHYCSKCGSGILAIYNDIGDKFPRFRELNPKFADCVYDNTLAKKHICSYFIQEIDDVSGGLSMSSYVLYLYTKTHIYAYKLDQQKVNEATTPDSLKNNVFCYNAWVSNNTQISSVEHGYSDIPIIEFANNSEMLGDAEPVFDLIASYNDIYNNRGKNINDIVNYLLKLKNIRIGDEEEQQKFLKLLEENHILAFEGDNADAQFISNPLNQDQMQTFQNTVKDLIHYISRVPDLSSVDFSQNASDPIIKIKTKPLLDLCKQKEKFFTKPYLKVIKIVLEWCKKNDDESEFEKYNFDTNLISLNYTHTLPSNDSDMITMITNLSNSGMANPEVLLENLSFIPNVHDYIKGMVVHNEYVDKRKKETQNNNTNGFNEHNLEMQNKEPLTKAKMDNKSNFNKGNAKTLSENKVQ